MDKCQIISRTCTIVEGQGMQLNTRFAVLVKVQIQGQGSTAQAIGRPRSMPKRELCIRITKTTCTEESRYTSSIVCILVLDRPSDFKAMRTFGILEALQLHRLLRSWWLFAVGPLCGLQH